MILILMLFEVNDKVIDSFSEQLDQHCNTEDKLRLTDTVIVELMHNIFDFFAQISPK